MRSKFTAMLVLILGTAALADTSAIWQGFSRSWKEHPHRISWFGSRFQGISRQGSTVEGKSWNRIKIGAFPPDVCHSGSYGAAVSSSALRFFPGSKTVTLSGPLGSWAEGKATVQVDLGAYASWNTTVLLRGFDIESSESHGWHSRGFYIGVENPRVLSNGQLEFEVSARFRAENSPDPLTRQTGDFSYTVQIAYVALAANPAQSAFTAVTKLQSVEGDGLGRAPRPTVAEKLTSVQGKSGSASSYREAFVGIKKIGFSLDADTKNKGRYVRHLDFFVENFDYDATTRNALFETSMYFSNKGSWTYAFNASMQADLLLVELADSGAETKTFTKKFDINTEEPTTVPFSVSLNP